jgi:hypothetical protein
LLTALDDVDAAIADNIRRGQEIRDRVGWFRDQLRAGTSAHDLVAEEAAPRTVEMLTANSNVLDTAGAAFRVRLAQALREDGLTIEAIADLFGVTRQRISALLRQHANA